MSVAADQGHRVAILEAKPDGTVIAACFEFAYACPSALGAYASAYED